MVRELLHAFHVRFESWINFQNESFLIKMIHALFGITARFEPGTFRFWDTYRCSVFTDWRMARSCVNVWLIYNPWSISEQNFWHVQNSVVTFGQDFVVPQVMESGPITNFCQCNHQKLNKSKCIRFSRYCWRCLVVRWAFHVRKIHCSTLFCAFM